MRVLFTLSSVVAAALAASPFDTTDPIQSATVTVDPTNITHVANKYYLGCHSDSGYTHQARGFYAQMILGESFEVSLPGRRALASTSTGGGTFTELQSVKDTSKRLRHCELQAFATNMEDGNGDFMFSVVPALNKAPNAVSFQSANFATMHLTSAVPDQGVEAGRVGIANATADPDSASFEKVVVNGSTLAFKSLSKDYPGYYVSVNGKLTGGCATGYDKVRARATACLV